VLLEFVERLPYVQFGQGRMIERQAQILNDGQYRVEFAGKDQPGLEAVK